MNLYFRFVFKTICLFVFSFIHVFANANNELNKIHELNNVNIYTISPVLTSPSAGTAYSSQIPVTLTLGEAYISGSAKLIFTNISGTYSNTLTLTDNISSLTFTITTQNVLSTINVSSSTYPTLPDGTYNVTLSYRGLTSPSASEVTNSNVVIQTSTPAPTLTSPANGHVFNRNASPVFSYTIPSAPFTGTAILTLSPGYAYPLSNTIGSNNYTITTNLPVDGTYTTTVSYQDFLGNPSSTSGAIRVTFDRVTLAPSILSPITNTTISGISTITYSVPETAMSGSKKLTFSKNGSTITTLTINDINGGNLFLNLKDLSTTSSQYSSLIGTSNIEDGIYSVTFSYQDQLGNPASSNTINIKIKERINVNYVDSVNGNDLTGIGSFNLPYKSIQFAIDNSLDNDSVLVQPGTYNESILINKAIVLKSIGGYTKTKIIKESSLGYALKAIGTFNNPYRTIKIQGFNIKSNGIKNGIGIRTEQRAYTEIDSVFVENFETALSTYYGYYLVRNSIFNKNRIYSWNDAGDADKTPISQYVTVLNTSNAVNLAGENIVNKFYNSIFVNDSNYKHESNIESLFQGPRVFLYDVIIDKAYTPGSGSRILLVKNAQELFFNDLDKNDFSLRNYSPAIGFGTIITGINNDIQGKNRPLSIGSKPDIGAFENIFDHPAPYINTDSSINGVILLKMTQNPAGTVNKYNIYKGLTTLPTTKYKDTTLITRFIDSANSIFNKIIYYRLTSVGASNIESGYSNEIRTISFTAPSLNFPIDLSIKTDTNLNFQWEKIDNATNYTLQYSTDSNFITNVVELTRKDTFYLKNNLVDNTTYFWRLQTRDSVNHSKWSNIKRFQTLVRNPILNSISTNNRFITLNWSVANNKNIKYFKIYSDTVINPIKLKDSISGQLDNYIDKINLQLNTKYYYRIVAGNQQNIESDFSNVLSVVPVNALPKAIKLVNKTVQNAGEFNFVKLSFSASGSIDIDGKISSYNWYVNDSLVNKTDSVLNYFFKLGSNTVKLLVTDNDGGKDSSTALVKLSSLQKVFPAGILGGISAINPNYILTADTSFNNTTGSSVSILDRSGNTILPIIVQSKIFTTPSIASDTSIFITNGSSLNGYSKSGVSLWPTIPLGGISYVTPTIDSNFNRIYVGVSNKNFFAYDYKTGKNVWSIICDAPINTSAVITGDRKLIFTSQTGTLYGFDISKSDVQTTPKWKMSFGDIITKSPAVDASSNIYVGTNAGRLIKFMLNTNGSVSVKWNVSLGSAIQTSPVIDADSNIYVGTEKGDFYKINRLNGSTIWSYNVGAAIYSTPNISEYGTIYVSNMNGLVTAITTDKRVLWKYQDIGPISANSLYINNMLYVATEKGTFTGIYDNPNSVNVNTNISSSDNSISSSLNNITTSNILKATSTNISSSTSLIAARMPVWGTFQGDYRRTGSLSLICPSSLSISKAANGNLVTNTPNYIQWYKDGSEILNATDSIFKPTVAGNYFIKNNQVGCNTVTSNSYYFVVTDIVNLEENQFIKVTPNPYSSNIYLHFFLKGYNSLSVDVLDFATGRPIANRVKQPTGSNLNLQSLSAGVYVIKVYSLDMKFVHMFKIVKL
jgi:outer membrane protein assembly factor BamB